MLGYASKIALGFWWLHDSFCLVVALVACFYGIWMSVNDSINEAYHVIIWIVYLGLPT